jgi:hypothetical protein
MGNPVRGCAVAIDAGLAPGGRPYRRVQGPSDIVTCMTVADRLWVTVSPPVDERLLLPKEFPVDARADSEALVEVRLPAGGRLRFQARSSGMQEGVLFEQLQLQLTPESDAPVTRDVTIFQESTGVTNAHIVISGHKYVVPSILAPGWYQVRFSAVGHQDWQMPVLIRPGETTDIPVDLTPR